MRKEIDSDVRTETWVRHSHNDRRAVLPVSVFQNMEVVIVSLDLMHQMLDELGWEPLSKTAATDSVVSTLS